MENKARDTCKVLMTQINDLVDMVDELKEENTILQNKLVDESYTKNASFGISFFMGVILSLMFNH